MATIIYGSLADANEYFTETEPSGTWDTFNDTQKNAALVKATKQIDRLKYQGEKDDFQQVREFPRRFWENFFLFYFDLDPAGDVIIPPDVIEATFIQAKFILDSQDDERIQAITLGITSQSIGATSESYDKTLSPIDVKTRISTESEFLLDRFLIVGF